MEGPPLGYQPPPGWYPAEPGVLRYWDGRGWTAHQAPDPAAARDPGAGSGQQRVLAALVHAGFLLFPVIVPVVVYNTEAGRDPLTRAHAAEALNFHLTFVILWVGFIGVLFAAESGGRRPPGWLLPAMVGSLSLGLFLSLVGVVQALRRRRFRYFAAIPFVRP